MQKKIGWVIILSMLFSTSLLAQSIQFSTQRIIDVPTEEHDGCTLVALKTVAQMLNLNMTEDEANQRIKLMDMGNVLTLHLGKRKSDFNGQTIVLGTAPIRKEGITYVPLRTVAEQFGYKLTSREGQLIISRSLSEQEKQTIAKWYSCCNYGHYGILSSYDTYKEEEGELPLKEAKESISAQIKVIKADISLPETSQLVKVLGKECISILQQLPALYDMALEGREEEFKKEYNRFLNRFQYMQAECHYISGGEFSNKYIERKRMKVAPYDEVKVSTGYNYAMNRLKDEYKNLQKRFLSNDIHMEELLYRISTTSQVIEEIKDIKSQIRSKESDEVIEIYLSYAYTILDYDCEMRRTLYSPEDINPAYQKAVIEAEKLMEATYKEYMSFGQ